MVERVIITRQDSSEVFQYDFEGYPVLSRVGVMSGWRNRSVDVHWHDDLEFTVVRKGTMDFLVNGKHVRVGQGEGIFINSRRLHGHTSEDENCEYLCTLAHPMLLCASGALERDFVSPGIGESAPDFVRLTPGESWQAAVVCGLEQIHDLREDADAPLEIQGLLYDIWLELYRNAFSAGQKPTDKGEDYHLNAARSMILYVRRHFKEKVLLEEIAKAGAVSKSTCLALFQKYLHSTPIRYVIQCRVEAAAELLKTTALPVTEIAYECGFSGTSYFIETFKKVYGCSPLEYRRQERRG